MAFPLTEEQLFAVDSLETNCIVKAGAGSGKTRVLVERFIKIIEEYGAKQPEIIENIVAITFTEKAAKEMKNRVRERMLELKEVEFNNDNIKKALFWQDNMKRIEHASISTIHAFCAKILREFPVEASIDPEFKVLDETEASWLLMDIVERELKAFLNKEKEHPLSSFYQWVVLAGFHRVTNQLAELYKKTSSFGVSVEEIIALTNKSLSSHPYDIVSVWDELLDAGEHLFNESEGNKKLSEYKLIWPQLREDILSAIHSKTPLDHLIHRMAEVTKGNFGSQAKVSRKKANEQAKKIQELLEAMKLHDFEADYIGPVHHLLKRIDTVYKREKEKVNGLDFDELQNRVIRLLAGNSGVNTKLKGRISFLLIDEFQDNNQVQKRLIDLLLNDDQKLKRPGSLFVVGDPKQSIYRFRGADVNVFKEMEQEISKNNGRIAPLQFNFRSDANLIDFINFFFSYIMSLDELSPNYYQEAIGVKELEDNSDVVEYIPIYPDRTEDIRRTEAGFIAKRIEELLDEGVEAKEIVILFKALTDIKSYENALVKRNIPYYVVGGRGFYDKQEINDILNVLEYLIDTTNEVALTGILRSPMVSLTDDTLYKLIEGQLLQSPIEHWKDSFSDIKDLDQGKIINFSGWIEQIRSLIGRVKVDELIEKIIEETQYRPILLALSNGTQAIANIEKLMRLARNFPGDNPYSIYEFIQRIHRLTDEGQQEKEAAVDSESGDVVKLMTIHQSKGLEFPYVFIPDLSRKPIYDKHLIRFDIEHGLTIKVPNEHGQFANPIRLLSIADRDRRLEQEESVRVFYVAATRAIKKVIFSGKVDTIKEDALDNEIFTLESWSKWLDAVLHYDNISTEDNMWSYQNKKGKVDKIKIFSNQEPSLVTDDNFWNRPDYLKNHPQLQHSDNSFPYLEPIEDTGEENFLSISAIKRYLFCPQYYNYTDIFSLYEIAEWVDDKTNLLTDDLPSSKEEMSKIGLNPMIKGTLVHKLLEHFTIQPNGVEEWEEILQQEILINGWTDDLFDSEAWNSFIHEVSGFVDNYKNSRLAARNPLLQDVKTEYEFLLRLKNGKIHGIIDRLEIYDEHFSIIDYKTDREMNANLYHEQILTYALAINRLTKLKPDKGFLYFIRHNVFEEIDINENMLRDWEVSLEEILIEIREAKNKNFFDKNTSNCSRCIYNKICNKNK